MNATEVRQVCHLLTKSNDFNESYSSKRYAPDPAEIGKVNPLDEYVPEGTEDEDRVILRVKLTISSSKISLSHPDPDFHLALSIHIAQSSRPGVPVTISTGRSALDIDSLYTDAFRLQFITDDTKSPRLTTAPYPNYVRDDLRRDLKEISWLKFITVPAEGTVEIRHPLPLERMLEESSLSHEDL